MFLNSFLAAAALAAPEEPVYLEHIRTLGPVAHFRLDGLESADLANVIPRTNVPARSVHVDHGGQAVLSVPGPNPLDVVGTNRLNGFAMANQGLSFRHADTGRNAAVVIPGDSIPDFAGPHADAFSLSVWVKADRLQPDRAGLVSRKAGDGLDTYQFALSLWSGRYDILLHHADGSVRSAYPEASPNGEWQHLVFVLDSDGWFEGEAGMMRFYVNGDRVFSGKTGNQTRTQMIPSTRDVLIGGIAYGQPDEEGFNRGFNGVVDELTLWDRALSDDEVSTLHRIAVIGRRPTAIIIGSLQP